MLHLDPNYHRLDERELIVLGMTSHTPFTAIEKNFSSLVSSVKYIVNSRSAHLKSPKMRFSAYQTGSDMNSKNLIFSSARHVANHFQPSSLSIMNHVAQGLMFVRDNHYTPRNLKPANGESTVKS